MPSPTDIRRVSRAAEKYRRAKAERFEAIKAAVDSGTPVSEIAKANGSSRAAIYKMLTRTPPTDRVSTGG